MKRTILYLFTLFIYLNKNFSQQPLQPVGQWRDHLPYKSAIDVVAGNGKLYCATPYSLFSVNIAANSIDRMSRITGLSETGVSAIGYDEVNEKLLIAYKNSNIDIVYRNDIFNVPDIKRDNITGDKTIYNVFSFNKKFYLSSGLGVIVINGDRYEVDDTWFIGNNGGQVKVNGFTADVSFFYAATAEGLKKTSLNTGNPANYQDWENLSGVNGLPAGSCSDVITIQNRVVALKNDSLFILNGSQWDFFFNETGWNVMNINSSSGELLVCQRKNDGNAKVTVLNANGTIAKTLQQPGLISMPRRSIFFNNDYWLADQSGGLTKFMSSGFENYNLNSPESTASGELVVYQGNFYAAAGEVNEAWVRQLNKNGIYKFSSGEWTNYNRKNLALLDTMPDFITVAIDRHDESVWAGSYGGGLLHIKTGNTFEIFKQNSPIGQAVFDPGSYRVAGLALDDQNNLWLSNYGANQNLLVKMNNGNWKSFTIPFALIENATSQIVIDDINQKWIVSPNGNGLICFNDGNSIENTGDDQWKLYRVGAGAGNLPSKNVLSIAKDKNGFVWVGTDDGIGVIQCPENVFSPQGCDAFLPVVQKGNFSSFLFKGENVRSIATDGADRKWVATANGVWLISPDGEKIIYQFTESNSPLLSDDVKKIAIEDKTGEVYFATKNGICSFRSTATEGAGKNENVLVFPNPVPPGYGGTIAIRGLVNNAIVKITEMDGRLVYQTRALGGQAVWDGKDYKGKKVSSGVYLVLITDDTRKENLAAKIIFINQ
jgi:hypothetical protein